MNNNEHTQPEKENLWRNKLKELSGIGDKLGLGLDAKIKETVAILQLLNINTSGSCEGHADRALAAPWIDIDAPNEPDENFIGENKIYQKHANKYNLSFEDVKYAVHLDVWRKAYNEAEKNGRNPELITWRRKNQSLKQKLEILLKEFYQNRTINKDNKIEIEVYGVGETNRLHNGGDDYGKLVTDMPLKQQEELPKKLKERQSEMIAFTEFLKEKYFNEN